MNKYKNFSVADFLQDEFFLEWVKNPLSGNGEIWEKWLEENPDMAEVVAESKRTILALSDQPVQLPENFYEQLKYRIDTTLNFGVDKEAKTIRIPMWLKLAAVCIGLIVGLNLLLKPSANKVNYFSYKSNYGETKKIKLPDGSEVTLNANSFLKYAANGINDNREVWLDGEGYFSIKHLEDDNKKPVKFIVHTVDVNVEVLGTQFNINSVKANETEVLLTKGKVRLSVPKLSAKPVSMSPGDLILFDNKTKKLSLNKVSPENYIAWMDHRYVFEKTSLEDLSKVLSRYYGKSLIIKDKKMRKHQLSGTLELQDENTLMQTLSILLKVRVGKEGDQIIIDSK